MPDGVASDAATEERAAAPRRGTQPGGDHPPFSTWFRATDPATLAILVALACCAVLIAVRLGPALLGLKTFTPVDMIGVRAPWWDGRVVPAPLNPYIGDPMDDFLPAYIQLHARLFSGDIPWWSSLSGPGGPLLAQPTIPIFTPSAIVHLFFPTWWAAGVAKLLQVLMAVAGMALWLRRVGVVWVAGLLAGLIYLGTGFFAAWGDWSAQASVAALMPALFWLIERHVQTRTLRSALPISAVVAFLLYGGFPAAAGHALYAGAAYFIVRLIAERDTATARSGLGTFALGVGAVALGVGLSALQFLPQVSSLLGTDLSYRDNQFNGEQPLKSLLTVVVPRALNLTGFAGSNLIEAYAYVGAGALFLCGLALVAPRSTGVARGVLGFAVVGGLLAAALVWKHGWWTDWMANLPVFQGNNSGRLRDLVGLLASAMAGIGMNLALQHDLARQVRRRLTVAGVVGTLGVVAVFAVIWRRYGDVMDHATFWWDSAFAVATAALVVVVVALGRKRWIATAGMAAVLVLLTVQTNNSVAYFWPMSSKSDFYPANPVIQAAQTQSAGQRIATVGTFVGSTAGANDLRTITGHTFQPTTWNDLLKAIDPLAYSGEGRTPTNPTISLNLEDGSLANPLLDRLSANTVVVAARTPIPGSGRLPDGGAAPTRPAPGPDKIAVANHSTVSLPIAAGAIRAVEVFSTDDLRGGPSGVQLTATVTDSSGAVLASGSVRQPAVHHVWYQIPVAGEDLAGRQGPLRLTIGVAGQGPQATGVTLAATGRVPTVRIVGSADDGLRETFAGDQGTVWQRPTALPRIRWAQQSQVIATPAARLAALAGTTLPREAVVLSAAGPASAGKPATLTTLDDTGDDVTVRVDAAGAGYLVVADSMQSGWKVSIDGAAAQLVDADHAFSGVFVPAGQHTVSFRYGPRGLTGGIAVTGASLLVLVALYVLARRRPTALRADGGGATTGVGFGRRTPRRPPPRLVLDGVQGPSRQPPDRTRDRLDD
jgi:hypothetical protein